MLLHVKIGESCFRGLFIFRPPASSRKVEGTFSFIFLPFHNHKILV